MNNMWFQYKIGKQLDALEIEDSLCLSLFKSLENCIKFKKLSNIGLKEAEIKRDTEILREKILKNSVGKKKSKKKNLKRIFKSF